MNFGGENRKDIRLRFWIHISAPEMEFNYFSVMK